MTRFALLPITALLALGACQNTSPETEATADAAAADANLAAPIELPPAEQARVNFRCQPGNTTQTVVFYAGDRQVGMVDGDSPEVTILKRTEEQGPYTLPTDAATAPAGVAGNTSSPAARELALTGDQQRVVITETDQPTRTCSI